MQPAVKTNPTPNLANWQKVAAARRYLMSKCPYFDTILMMLAPVEAPGLGTVGVTKNMILLIDLDYINRSTVEGVAGDLIHEIMHVLRGSHDRTHKLGCCTPEQLRLSNEAADAAINPDVIAMGFPMPDCIMPEEHFDLPNGLLHEEYYAAGRKKEKSKEDGDGHGPRGKPGTGKGRCGSGGGNPMPGEPDESDPRGRTPAEVDRGIRHTAEAVRAAAQSGRGNLPGNLIRWAEETLKPAVVPWQQKLARAARNAIQHQMGLADFKFDGPSRKQAGVGYGPGKPILPRLRAPVPRVEFIIDTSGSMGTDSFSQIGPELASVMRAVGAEVSFVAIDTQINAQSKVRTWKEVLPLLKGGGGTDFADYFSELASRPSKDKPNVAIFASDMEASGVPSLAPKGIDFIWLSTTGALPPCDWGTFIGLELEGQSDMDDDA